MKTIRFYLMAALMAAIILPSVTSCLDSKDDDNNSTPARSLTDSEKSIIMSIIAGDYEGKLYYIKTDQKEDSIYIHYTITASDSVLRINDFDFKTLERPLLTWGEEASKTAAQAGLGVIELVLHPYYNQYFSAGDYTFNYSFDKPFYFNFNDGEKDHSIVMTLGQYVDYMYAYETLRYYNFVEYYSKQMQGNLIIKSMNVDGLQANVNTVLGFNGKKL